jgi:hypothetical protein
VVDKVVDNSGACDWVGKQVVDNSGSYYQIKHIDVVCKGT